MRGNSFSAGFIGIDCPRLLEGVEMARRAVIAVSELDTYNIARDLIQSGLRLSTVEMFTGLSVRWLRAAYREITGTAPKNGRVPSNCLCFIKNFQTAGRLSAFVTLHQKLHGSTALDARKLLETWRAYERLCGEFDINAGFYGCRDVHDGTVVLAACHNCRTEFIYDRASRYTDRCSYCHSTVV